MANKEELLRAVTKMVTAQQRSLSTGGLQDVTLTDRVSPGEETQEDDQILAALLSPLDPRKQDA